MKKKQGVETESKPALPEQGSKEHNDISPI